MDFVPYDRCQPVTEERARYFLGKNVMFEIEPGKCIKCRVQRIDKTDKGWMFTPWRRDMKEPKWYPMDEFKMGVYYGLEDPNVD